MGGGPDPALEAALRASVERGEARDRVVAAVLSTPAANEPSPPTMPRLVRMRGRLTRHGLKLIGKVGPRFTVPPAEMAVTTGADDGPDVA